MPGHFKGVQRRDIKQGGKPQHSLQTNDRKKTEALSLVPLGSTNPMVNINPAASTNTRISCNPKVLGLEKRNQVYKVANKILGKRKQDDLSHFIANQGGETEAACKINDHFSDKVHQLKLKLRDQRTCDPLSKLSPSKNKFSFQDVSISQVEKIIRKMKNSHSSGPDGITSAQLKLTIRTISPVLSLMINTSFITGLFPSVFKESWVSLI